MKIYENHFRFQLNIKIFLYGSLQYLQNITGVNILQKKDHIDMDNAFATKPWKNGNQKPFWVPFAKLNLSKPSIWLRFLIYEQGLY